MRSTAALLAVLLAAPVAAQDDPFARLSQAYRNRDAAAAASAYTPDAAVVYRYEGAPAERHIGTTAIADSFRDLFAQIDPDAPVDLNFRVTARTAKGAEGFYRLRIGTGAAAYGQFSVTFGADGRFTTDTSTGATIADFEEASGPVLVAPDDEVLDRGYYASLTGRYRLPDGCDLVVTRSVVRLFLRNSCTGDWRGLTRVSGREWTAGDRVRSDTVSAIVRFAGQGTPDTISLASGGQDITARRTSAYRTEDIAFRSADGTLLHGTVYIPAAPVAAGARRAATVLVHGSGPQDRDGYASIIAVMADALAANGRIVLAYDKRGSGQSEGDGERAGFDVLAEDALAGMRALAARPDVDPVRIGIAGSSQAGWVAAEAIRRAPGVADVLLLGAAGSAMTVIEQNLYNTKVRMDCAGIPPADIDLALDQQRAFFAFVADPAKAAALDALTATGHARPGLADWLFPDSASTDLSGGQWFTVLAPEFDPRPVWQAYKGRKLFLFSEHDDATPTAIAMERSASDGAEVRLLPSAQHLGLIASGPCKAELTDVSAFASELFEEIASFAKGAR
jgi:hypothetical protein